MAQKIKSSRFFYQWKGHPLEDMDLLRKLAVSKHPDQPIIYLAGDSSLDNKCWVSKDDINVEIPEIYHEAFDKPSPKPDVAFWLNSLLDDRATSLNLAVEESMLRERANTLLEHDTFICDNIRAEDILIVSIGGNDIALKPTLSTAASMLQLAYLTPLGSLERGDAWSMSHFIRIFKDEVAAYVSKLVEKQKPRAVIICMIYYPLEKSASQTSWADVPLKALRYDSFPQKLQTGIRKMYELATQKIEIEGTKIIPCALFDVLDSKDANDFTARVEPSAQGGSKMASHFVKLLEEHLGSI